MSIENVALKDRFVAAVFAGDQETLRSVAHPDFELWQNRLLPYGGTYKGAEGFLAFLEKFSATFEIEQLENTRTFTSDSGGVVSEFAFKGKLLSNGRPFDTKLIEVWDFADGKVLKIVTYWFETPNQGAA